MAVEDVVQRPRPILPAADSPNGARRTPSVAIWNIYRLWSRAISQLLAWVCSKLPLDLLIKRLVRWLAFGASRQRLKRIIWLCQETVLPIASGALALAELREAMEEACESNDCAPEVREQLEETVRVVAGSVEEALDKVFLELDSDGDGVLTLEEAASVLRGQPNRKKTLGTVAVVLEASNRASEALKATEALKDGIGAAVDEAVAVVDGAIDAIDEDGDGVISVQEALAAPSNVAQWWAKRFSK